MEAWKKGYERRASGEGQHAIPNRAGGGIKPGTRKEKRGMMRIRTESARAMRLA